MVFSVGFRADRRIHSKLRPGGARNYARALVVDAQQHLGSSAGQAGNVGGLDLRVDTGRITAPVAGAESAARSSLAKSSRGLTGIAISFRGTVPRHGSSALPIEFACGIALACDSPMVSPLRSAAN